MDTRDALYGKPNRYGGTYGDNKWPHAFYYSREFLHTHENDELNLENSFGHGLGLVLTFLFQDVISALLIIVVCSVGSTLALVTLPIWGPVHFYNWRRKKKKKSIRAVATPVPEERTVQTYSALANLDLTDPFGMVIFLDQRMDFLEKTIKGG